MAEKTCRKCGVTFTAPGTRRQFCSRKCSGKGQRRPPKHPPGYTTPENEIRWWLDPKGYFRGSAWVNGVFRRLWRHRWIMEQHLGRRLRPSEIVHHRNRDSQDNRLANLEIKTPSTHCADHNRQRRGEKRKMSPQGLANLRASIARMHARRNRA